MPLDEMSCLCMIKLWSSNIRSPFCICRISHHVSRETKLLPLQQSKSPNSCFSSPSSKYDTDHELAMRHEPWDTYPEASNSDSENREPSSWWWWWQQSAAHSMHSTKQQCPRPTPAVGVQAALWCSAGTTVMSPQAGLWCDWLWLWLPVVPTHKLSLVPEISQWSYQMPDIFQLLALKIPKGHIM